jgi:hypothetical protein
MSYNNRFYQGSRIDTFQRQYRAFSGAFSPKQEIDNGGKSRKIYKINSSSNFATKCSGRISRVKCSLSNVI